MITVAWHAFTFISWQALPSESQCSRSRESKWDREGAAEAGSGAAYTYQALQPDQRALSFLALLTLRVQAAVMTGSPVQFVKTLGQSLPTA